MHHCNSKLRAVPQWYRPSDLIRQLYREIDTFYYIFNRLDAKKMTTYIGAKKPTNDCYVEQYARSYALVVHHCFVSLLIVKWTRQGYYLSCFCPHMMFTALLPIWNWAKRSIWSRKQTIKYWHKLFRSLSRVCCYFCVNKKEHELKSITSDTEFNLDLQTMSSNTCCNGHSHRFARFFLKSRQQRLMNNGWIIINTSHVHYKSIRMFIMFDYNRTLPSWFARTHLGMVTVYCLFVNTIGVKKFYEVKSRQQQLANKTKLAGQQTIVITSFSLRLSAENKINW